MVEVALIDREHFVAIARAAVPVTRAAEEHRVHLRTAAAAGRTVGSSLKATKSVVARRRTDRRALWPVDVARGPNDARSTVALEDAELELVVDAAGADEPDTTHRARRRHIRHADGERRAGAVPSRVRRRAGDERVADREEARLRAHHRARAVDQVGRRHRPIGDVGAGVARGRRRQLRPARSPARARSYP